MKSTPKRILPAIVFVIAEAISTAVFALENPTVAQVELCTGKVRFNRTQEPRPASNGLAAGDSVRTGADADSRCRISLGQDRILHLGPDSEIRVTGDHSVALFDGGLVAYVMPGLGQAAPALEIQIKGGLLALTMGKIYAENRPGSQQVAVFNDLVSASWRVGQKQTTLYPGNLVRFDSPELKIDLVPRTMEADMSEKMSPEPVAVKLASAAYQRRDFVSASRLFGQIRQAFPYNPAAAYHLGVLELNAGKTAAANSQWRDYAEIDPKGAEAKGIPRQLTLINKQLLRDDVRQAIAREKTLSSQPPEPNSIAVNPLINKGAEQYGPIGKGLTAFVITDLMKVPGLKVLEREKLQALIDEIKLSEAGGLVEKNSRLRADRIMRAEKLMIGEYLIQSGEVAP